jgi:hypothetical protein
MWIDGSSSLTIREFIYFVTSKYTLPTWESPECGHPNYCIQNPDLACIFIHPSRKGDTFLVPRRVFKGHIEIPNYEEFSEFQKAITTCIAEWIEN